MCVCVCVCVCVESERDRNGKSLGLSLLPAYANQDPLLKWLMLRTPFANIAHIVMTVGWLSLSFIAKNRGKQLCNLSALGGSAKLFVCMCVPVYLLCIFKDIHTYLFRKYLHVYI